MPDPHYAKLTTAAGFIASGVALLLIVMKLIAWILSGASSMLASLTDSLMDLCASLINLFALRYAVVPPDNEHRFGHGKAEPLAGLAQAAFISGSSFFLIMQGLSDWVENKPIRDIEIAMWVSIFSVVITLALVAFQAYVVRKTASLAIKADMLHYRSDLLMNLGVVAAIFLATWGWNWIDALFAIVVGLYLLYGSILIGHQSVQALLDRELPERSQQKVIDLCCQVDGVRGLHDLRTRQAGPVTFVQLHLELDDHLALIDAHTIVEAVENKLHEYFTPADIIIHMDPLSAVGVQAPHRCQIRHHPESSSIHLT